MVISWIVRAAIRWAKAEQAAYAGYSVPIAEAHKRFMGGFFEQEALNAVRIVLVERIPAPALYERLSALGIPLPDYRRRFVGITLQDYIFISNQCARDLDGRRCLLFHELVHVVQYRVLGLEQFMSTYINEWLAVGCRYRRICHEVMAAQLTTRYLQEPGRPFNVKAIVEQRLERSMHFRS